MNPAIELFYEEQAVEQRLAQHAMCHWRFEAKGRESSSIHITPPTASLVLLFIQMPYFQLVKLTAVGLEMRHIEVPTPARFIGFRFYLAALSAFFPISIFKNS